MKKLLSFIAVTVTAATAVAAGAYIVKKLEQEKDEEVKLIEIINEDESEKKTSVEDKSEPENVVVEEVSLEKLVEEQIAEEFAPEETEVVEEIVEEQPVEEVEEVVEEIIEEQPVEEIEEVVEEIVEEQPVEEVEEVVDPYHLLSERKKNAICNQIQVMIESMEEFEEVGLQHYIVFPTPEATEEFLSEVEEAGYDIFVEENGQEVNLIKNSQLEREGLEIEILSLAQLAAEYTGAYKGWAVKIDE